MYNTGFKKWDRNDVVRPRHCVSSHMASTGKYIEKGITLIPIPKKRDNLKHAILHYKNKGQCFLFFMQTL